MDITWMIEKCLNISTVTIYSEKFQSDVHAGTVTEKCVAFLLEKIGLPKENLKVEYNPEFLPFYSEENEQFDGLGEFVVSRTTATDDNVKIIAKTVVNPNEYFHHKLQMEISKASNDTRIH